MDYHDIFRQYGQVYKKSYSVTSASYQKRAIITATLNFILEEEGTMQETIKSKPKSWVVDVPVDERQSRMRRMIESANEKFRHLRRNYVAQLMKIVQHESDDVSACVQELTSSIRKCVNPACSKQYNSLKRKCSQCGSKVEKCKTSIRNFVRGKHWPKEKNFDIGQLVYKNLTKMKVGEPIMVNPNSYETTLKCLSVQV